MRAGQDLWPRQPALRGLHPHPVPRRTNPLTNDTAVDKDDVLAAINEKWNDRKKVAIGYIGTESERYRC